jgi:putative nucleotidyltransferase with HDIG domain
MSTSRGIIPHFFASPIIFLYLRILILLGLPLVLARVALQNYVQLQSETMQTIETLADVIDKGDPHTFQHSQRVSKYAVQLARRLNLPEVDVQLIGSAARIHDLGKVTIPTNILQKTGKLTAEEFEVVKGHPAEGAKLVENLSLYQQGLDLILHHHERFDGTGYPSGLKENSIPLGARVICVADAFDAMTSDRPYRKAMSLDNAILELKGGMGTQFDPYLASAFINYLEETTDVGLTEAAVSSGS